MLLFKTNRPDFLEAGERARLIPVVADTSKEGRITGCLLATFMSVDEFAKGLLSSIGIILRKTSKVECFTEIVFKRKDKTMPKVRPDGLIVITTGKNQRMVLIEAKVNKVKLQAEQIDAYLDLAREYNIDTVVTISNQFAATPAHHPLTVKKNKLRHVTLCHWSWTFLITEAVMWIKYHGVTDPEQCYMLEELVRYFQHDSSGVMSFDRMDSAWKDVCQAVQHRMPLKKNSDDVREIVGSWHQFVRNLSLHLGLAIGENVTIFLRRNHKKDAAQRLADDSAVFASEHVLSAEFDIPDTSGRIKLTADAETRSVNVSMRLKAPETKVTAKGRINWFVNQLKKTTNEAMAIRVIWPGRAPDTMTSLLTIREQGISALISENTTLKPVAFEVVLARDLGTKFKGSKTFIKEAEPILLQFYEQAGQHLKEWVASPPKVKTTNTEAEALIEENEARSTVDATEKQDELGR